MRLEFSGDLWYWRGPSPFHFITVPEDESVELEAASHLVTYGWGMIPVTAQIGDTTWTTSLYPKALERQSELMEKLSPETRRKVLQDNAAKLYNIAL